MDNHRVTPFYMTYPLPMFYEQPDSVTNDLEYLRQIYPAEVKKYQRIIYNMLNRLDYMGSMIYDEYPDKLMLHRLAQDVLEAAKREENAVSGNASETTEQTEKWEWIGHLIHILLYYEIYTRRHSRDRGILRF